MRNKRKENEATLSKTSKDLLKSCNGRVLFAGQKSNQEYWQDEKVRVKKELEVSIGYGSMGSIQAAFWAIRIAMWVWWLIKEMKKRTS